MAIIKAPERWAIGEAAEVHFYSLATGEKVTTLDATKLTQVDTSGEVRYARGGVGNTRIVGFSGNREARVTVQNAIFTNEALEMLTGNKIDRAWKEMTERNFSFCVLNVDDIKDNKYTIPKSTLPGDIAKFKGDLKIFMPGQPGVTIKGPAAAATGPATGDFVVTFPTGVLAKDLINTKITVTYFVEKTGIAVRVTADQFAGSYRVVADVIVKDVDTGENFAGQFIAPKAKIEDNFSFSFSPDGDPSVLDVPMEILRDSCGKEIWELVIFDKEIA